MSGRDPSVGIDEKQNIASSRLCSGVSRRRDLPAVNRLDPSATSQSHGCRRVGRSIINDDDLEWFRTRGRRGANCRERCG
jgi:hypothetical protein